MVGGYNRKYRVKPRFFLFLLVFLGLLGWGVVALAGVLRPVKLEWGRLSSDQVFDAVVLRDETLVQSTEYAKLSCIAAEGQLVNKNDPVAMLYESGFSEKDLNTLLQQKNKIKDYQENNILKDIVNKDLEKINTSIKDKMDEISASAGSTETQNLLASEQELRALMEERRQFMLTIVHPDETLDMYYQQEKSLEDKINETRTTVPAKAAGLVSYYLDGHEKELTVAGIADMTPAKVRELEKTILHKTSAAPSDDVVEANQTLCRIVNPDDWYALIVVNKSENHMVEGSDYPMTFDGLRNTVTAHVEKVVNAGRSSLVVLKIADGVKEVLSLRLVKGWLGQDLEGFRVPLKMIGRDGEKDYISINTGNGGARRIEVKVLGRDSRYAIISQVNESDELVLGMTLSKP